MAILPALGRKLVKMNEVHVQKGGGLTDGERVPVAFQSSVPVIPSLFRYLRHLRVLPINSLKKKKIIVGCSGSLLLHAGFP